MMYRKPVNKRRSARSFRRNAKRTKSANMQKEGADDIIIMSKFTSSSLTFTVGTSWHLA